MLLIWGIEPHSWELCWVLYCHMPSRSLPCGWQVDPAIYDTPLKDLIGLAWLLARHKLSLDRHLEFNHLERQKKRKKNQVGVPVQTCPGTANMSCMHAALGEWRWCRHLFSL